MSNHEDLTQRITDLLAALDGDPVPWTVRGEYEVADAEGFRVGESINRDAAHFIAAAPTLLAECVSRITELEAEVARRGNILENVTEMCARPSGYCVVKNEWWPS